MKRPTIKDVAKHASVSTATVSRVFSKEPSVAASIAAKVRASAGVLNYRPSVIARSLTNSRTNLVALVVGRLDNPFDAHLVGSLSKQLYEIGQRLLVVPADYGENDPAAMVALDYQVDGIVVAAGHLSKASAERFVQVGVPVILYGRTMEAPGVDCIVADNAGAAQLLGRQFRRFGVRRALYVRHIQETFSDGERESGFKEGMGEKAAVQVLRCSNESARDASLNFLSDGNPPQAVFCTNDVLAFGVMEAAAQLGLSIPDDIMVAGFDDVDMAASPFYSLTTLRQSPSEISSWIVNRLNERLRNPKTAVTTQRVPAQLVLRGSTPSSNTIGGISVAVNNREGKA